MNQDSLELLSLRLFRFGLVMFLLAVFFGGWLWYGFGFSGRWLEIKFGMVVSLFLYFLCSGWLMYRAVKYRLFFSTIMLRIFNEASLFIVIPIIYLAVSKGA